MCWQPSGWGGDTAKAGSDSWSIVSSPNIGSGDNYLRGVTSVDSDNAWAVGSHDNGFGVDKTSVLYWNGTSWSQETSANPLSNNNELYAVSASSATSAWAVGYAENTGAGPAHTLALHRVSIGGTSFEWDAVTTPDPVSSTDNVLRGVATVDSTHAWAVGYGGTVSPTPIILKWNGLGWSSVSVPLPTGAQYGILYAVSAEGNNDVWAVGTYHTSGGGNDSLTLHWDGTAWSAITSPNGSGNNRLLGVKAIASDLAWAVGAYNWNGAFGHALTMQWDGSTWTKYDGAYPSNTDVLESVDYTFGTTVYGVGSTAGTSSITTLSQKWTGSAWTGVTTPNSGTGDNYLHSIAVQPGTSSCAGGAMWAVGDYVSGSEVYHTLILQYNITSQCAP